jgi:hypothetical protein
VRSASRPRRYGCKHDKHHPGTGAYIRRSKARKHDDRNASLAEQRAEIHEAADRDRRTITEVYDEGEGISASRFSRQRRPE